MSEANLSRDKQDDNGKAEKSGPNGGSQSGSERICAAPPKAGNAPGHIARKIVGQGKRREALKKWKKDEH